ncbi:MAG: hypothetical protein NVSMB47_03850 [Polyangiales bacterium]
MKLLVRVAVVTGSFAGLACGSAPPPTVEKPVVEQAPPSRPKEHASIEYDLGSIDPSVAKSRFDAIKSEWNDCYRAAHEKNEALAGMIKFSVRTNKDGSVKWAYVSATDLGSRSVEKCVLESVRQQNFGAPMDAKEGEIKDKSYGWELDGDDDRPADPGDVSQVLPALNKAKKRLADCREKGGAQGQLTATIYVAPKGKARSVGIAASDPSGDGAADCLVEVLSKLTYVNKSSWVTKVTVDLP